MKDLLSENPDRVDISDEFAKNHGVHRKSLEWNDEDSYVFGYVGNEIFIMRKGNHLEISYELDRSDWDRLANAIGYDDYMDIPTGMLPNSRNDYKYAGRLWAKPQVISFWDYPPKGKLNKIISDLNKHLNFKITKDWYIEVVDKGGKYDAPETTTSGLWKQWKTDKKDVKLVQISDYMGSEKQKGKGVQHVVSPMLKKKRDVMMGVGSRKKVKGAKRGEVPAATHFRQRKGLGDGVIKENPDVVVKYMPDGDIKQVAIWNSPDAVVFGYWNDVLFTQVGGNHHKLHYKIPDEFLRKFPQKPPRNRNDYKFAGRLWIDKKLISFWDYPSKQELKKVMKDLKKEGIRIDNNWKIEVVDTKGKYETPELGVDPMDDEKYWDVPTKFVTIKDYIGSEKQLNKGASHMLSPKYKKHKKIPMGVGSRKKVKGTKKGETPAATRFRTRKGLGDGVVKLKDLVNEELIGQYDYNHFKSFDIYKNPKSIKRMEPELRGVSFPNGDLFVIDDAHHILHNKLRDALNAHGYRCPDSYTKKDVVINIKKGYIDWQRKGKTNEFYLSESTDFNDTEWFDRDELMPYLEKYVKKVKSRNSQYKFILESIY